MKEESSAKWLRKLKLEHTVTSFHLVFAIAPALGAIVTTFIGQDLHLKVELGLVIAVTIINAGILWLRSKEARETQELSPFYTFWTDDLLPNHSGDRQSCKVSIGIIEDRNSGEFRASLQQDFKQKFDTEKLKQLLSAESRLKSTVLKNLKLEDMLVEPKNRDLFFDPLDLGPAGNDEDGQLSRAFQKYLTDNLDRSTAVVLVRSAESDERPWVYKALSDWGYEHSEVPILIAKDPEAKFSDDEAAKKFLWISKESRPLPWCLLQRALSRAKAWRTQATYNRSMVWNIFYISLLCVYIGAIWIKGKSEALANQAEHQQQKLLSQQGLFEGRLANQKAINDLIVEASDEATDTERSFRAHNSKKSDTTFGVSYWYRLDGKPHILVTTELPRTTQFLENDFKSIIGCAFVKRNHVIEGSVGSGEMRVTAYNNYLREVELPECRMAQLEQSAIKNIVCASFDDGSPKQSRTVGICAFTRDPENTFFTKAAQALIWERTQKFHTKFSRRIENRSEVSLAAREPKNLTIQREQ